MLGLTEPSERGIIPNAFEHIYGFLDDSANAAKKFLVRASYLEIYNEEVRDLLGKDIDKKLEVKEDKDKGIFVKDLTIISVKSTGEITQLMDKGNSLRKVGATAMNDTSSRSHSLFCIYIEQAETVCDYTFTRFISYDLCRSKESKGSRLASSTLSTWPVLSVRARPKPPA